MLEGKLACREDNKYRMMQAEVFSIWEDYTIGTKSATQLLKACSRLVHIPM